jgi:hypothetical protein
MTEFSLYEASTEPCINLKLKFDAKYTNIFDLGSTFFDLQSLLSGITRVYDDDNQNKFEVVSSIAPRIRNDEDYYERQRLKRIDDLIDNYFTEATEFQKRRFKKEIENELKGPNDDLIDIYKEPVIKPYPTSSRNFNKKYKRIVELEKFEQGSLLLTITSTVLAGIILKFVEKIAFEEDAKIKIEVNNNIIVINQDNGTKSMVRINDQSNKNSNATMKNSGIEIERYIDDVISRVELDKYDIEESVRSLLNVLATDGYFNKNIIYNKKGIKTIVNDIERFRGNYIDICS